MEHRGHGAYFVLRTNPVTLMGGVCTYGMEFVPLSGDVLGTDLLIGNQLYSQADSHFACTTSLSLTWARGK